MVGRALSLYWTADDAWYTGTVIAYNPDNGQHHIRYNDGELEWVLLGREQVRWGDAANGMERSEEWRGGMLCIVE